MKKLLVIVAVLFMVGVCASYAGDYIDGFRKVEGIDCMIKPIETVSETSDGREITRVEYVTPEGIVLDERSFSIETIMSIEEIFGE